MALSKRSCRYLSHANTLCAAIAGIYGMNFEHMPELKWAYGYYLVLGFIAVVCGTMFWQFRRNGWL
jgi:magnesium transporter